MGDGTFLDFKAVTVHRKERSIRRTAGILGQSSEPLQRLFQFWDRLKNVPIQESGRCIGLLPDFERGRQIRSGLTSEVACESAQQGAE